MATNDLQQLEARLAALENQISQMNQLLRSSGASGSGMQTGSSASTESPAAWLVGALMSSLTPPGSPGAQPGAQSPGMMMADSVFWCNSRFVCATMNCGGSGWC
jgi:hypothetical protein